MKDSIVVVRQNRNTGICKIYILWKNSEILPTVLYFYQHLFFLFHQSEKILKRLGTNLPMIR